jgi:hypothetical protein
MVETITGSAAARPASSTTRFRTTQRVGAHRGMVGAEGRDRT